MLSSVGLKTANNTPETSLSCMQVSGASMVAGETVKTDIRREVATRPGSVMQLCRIQTLGRPITAIARSCWSLPPHYD